MQSNPGVTLTPRLPTPVWFPEIKINYIIEETHVKIKNTDVECSTESAVCLINNHRAGDLSRYPYCCKSSVLLVCNVGKCQSLFPASEWRNLESLSLLL